MGELYGKRKAGELVKIEPEGTVKKPAFHVPMALPMALPLQIPPLHRINPRIQNHRKQTKNTDTHKQPIHLKHLA